MVSCERTPCNSPVACSMECPQTLRQLRRGYDKLQIYVHEKSNSQVNVPDSTILLRRIPKIVNPAANVRIHTRQPNALRQILFTGWVY